MICPNCGHHGDNRPGTRAPTAATPCPPRRQLRRRDSGDVLTRAHSPPVARTGPLAVGQAFGGRYHVIKVLGVGGMGAVYQAWDAELGVGCRAQGHPARGRRRTRQPPRKWSAGSSRSCVLARQVTHKNVVRIHDLGEIDGIKYITMPYLDGSDLATVLKRDGKLAGAGRAAHHPRRRGRARRRARSRHRASRSQAGEHHDRREDHAIIMDFGIARSATSQDAGEPPDRPVPDRRRARRRGGSHHDGNHPRHRQVHGARAGQRRVRRSARRYLRARPDLLGHAAGRSRRKAGRRPSRS